MNEPLESRWLLCPVCKSKTRIRLRADTVLENFSLFCPKYGQTEGANKQKSWKGGSEYVGYINRF